MKKITESGTEKPIRVALYARVSTSSYQDPEMQLSELREYAQRRGFQIIEEFVDRGVSGSRESRPALDRLMVDACRRRFDAVLVWKIDRFGRSLKHLVSALAEFGAWGVSFVSLHDNLDLTTPSGRLMFQISPRSRTLLGANRSANWHQQGNCAASGCLRIDECLMTKRPVTSTGAHSGNCEGLSMLKRQVGQLGKTDKGKCVWGRGPLTSDSQQMPVSPL